MSLPELLDIEITVNGAVRTVAVEPRTMLGDCIREALRYTGTHIGCEQGQCGSCTVLLDGQSVRSCLVLACQADGGEVVTVEGLSGPEEDLHPVQEAFRDNHALQCGFCTPGMLMSCVEALSEKRGFTEHEARSVLSGNLCRCTGYQGIVDAFLEADRNWGRSVPSPVSSRTDTTEGEPS
ncbi:MAG TPA: (2Fe-2S)-binding protein [Nocardioidaceae bacterium]|nr:(2Fe-2S)-binding protein [Nocardioidaceae bacterium]